MALDVPVSMPFAETRAPILEHVSLGVLDAHAISPATLSAGRGDQVNRVKINFQPFPGIGRHLVLRTPGAPVVLRL